jgi:alkanesulfonate monooxygenase SsuD/methylene tetrahydromethanopterin reductase-like flavin-dependent oxidoreductase (luciferase family)
VRERSALLDELLVAAGRRPGDVRRTFNAFVVCGRTSQEVAERLRGYRRYAGLAPLPQDQVLEQLRTEWMAIVGTPDEIVAQIQAYEAAGIVELSMQWPGIDDIEGLEIVAAEVLPRLRATAA